MSLDSVDSVHPVGDGPPFDASAAPETVVLKANRLRLGLAWRNGETSEIESAHLRAQCRCAWCTCARIDGSFAASFDGVAIERVAPVGDYAINIAFSDGHARGIYPWTYLRTIAQTQEQAQESAQDGSSA
jgi:prepilin-type processing-associated H-X9-DG protein